MIDGWAVIRRAASDLRRRARLENPSCTDATGLVEAAVETCGMRLVRFAVGSPYGPEVLGALQRWACCIHVAGALREADAAVVIAHEVGHLLLHRDIEQDLELTPASHHPAPGRTSRMSAYSPRERQEVEADAFADEFLCPVADLRNDLLRGLTPAEVARGLRVPTHLVMRQAARSLLPPDAAGAGRGADAVVLNARQDEAARWMSSHLIVEGAPGTGKTTTLAARAARLLASVDAGSLAVLAPSDRAVGILRTKVRGGTAMWMSTFNALGLDIIRKRPERMGRTSAVRLLDEAAALALLRSCTDGPPARTRRTRSHPSPAQMLKTIMRCKIASLGTEAFAAAVGAGAKADPRQVAAAKAYRACERALIDADAIDYSDLTAGAATLIETDREIGAAYRDRFAHVLVDEYEEADAGSLRLLRALCGPSTSLWATGWAGGSIDRFRHVAAGNVEGFGELFGGGRLVLHHAYRKADPPHASIAGGESGIIPAPVTDAACRSRRRADAIRDAIASARRDGVAHGDQAVLARTHDGLDEIARHLRTRGIPVLHLGDLWKRDEVKDLLAYLDAATGVADADALARLARLPRYRCVHPPGTALPQAVAASDGSDRRGPHRLADDVAALKEGADVWATLASWAFEDGIMPWLVDADAAVPTQERRLAVHHVLEVANGLAVGAGPTELLAGLRRLGSLNQETAFRKVDGAAIPLDAVRLMTVHAAKGREFGAVHLWDVWTPPVGRRPRPLVPAGLAGIDAMPDEAVAERCLTAVASSRERTRRPDGMPPVVPGVRSPRAHGGPLTAHDRAAPPHSSAVPCGPADGGGAGAVREIRP